MSSGEKGLNRGIFRDQEILVAPARGGLHMRGPERRLASGAHANHLPPELSRNRAIARGL